MNPEIITDISLGTLLGRGSGESIQLRFAGEGWVVVQPYEEVVFQSKEQHWPPGADQAGLRTFPSGRSHSGDNPGR